MLRRPLGGALSAGLTNGRPATSRCSGNDAGRQRYCRGRRIPVGLHLFDQQQNFRIRSSTTLNRPAVKLLLTSLIALPLLLAPGRLAAQAPSAEVIPSVTLPPALERVLRDYERSWQAGDATALAALFTPMVSCCSPTDLRSAATRNSNGGTAARAATISVFEHSPMRRLTPSGTSLARTATVTHRETWGSSRSRFGVRPTAG